MVWSGFAFLAFGPAGGTLTIDPFDDGGAGKRSALGNEAKHHSVWAAIADVATGSRTACPVATGTPCLDSGELNRCHLQPPGLGTNLIGGLGF